MFKILNRQLHIDKLIFYPDYLLITQRQIFNYMFLNNVRNTTFAKLFFDL